MVYIYMEFKSYTSYPIHSPSPSPIPHLIPQDRQGSHRGGRRGGGGGTHPGFGYPLQNLVCARKREVVTDLRTLKKGGGCYYIRGVLLSGSVIVSLASARKVSWIICNNIILITVLRIIVSETTVRLSVNNTLKHVVNQQHK